MEVKDLILKVVGESQGIKGTALVTKVTAVYYKSDGEIPDDLSPILKILESMVREGLLVEVEYIMPSMPYRIKSIYFPGGTEVFNSKFRPQ